MEQSFELAQKIGFRRAQANALLGLSLLMETKGDYDLAETYCDLLLKMASQQIGISALSLTCLGRINLVRDKHQTAYDYFLQALKSYQQIKMKKVALEAITGVGYYCEKVNDIPKAIELLFFVKYHESTGYELTFSVDQRLNDLLARVTTDMVDVAKQRATSYNLEEMVERLIINNAN